MARALNPADQRVLWRVLIVAMLLHAAVLIWAHYWLQPPSPIEKLPPPLYTRVLYPQAAAEPVPTSAVQATHRPSTVRRKRRPAARIETAPVVIASAAMAPDAELGASAPQPDASAASVASASLAPEPAASEPAVSVSAASESTALESATSEPSQPVASAASAATSAAQAGGDAVSVTPGQPASAAPPAFFDTWPPNTRLTYELTGNYRGELHGSAQVLWQRLFDRQRARYQTQVQLSLGLLLSMRFTSQGQITDSNLAPEVYEEHVGTHHRIVRINEDDVQLNNGKHVPRPDEVQDTASQFIELAHRFAANPAQLAPGGSVHLWLARPTGVDEWVYDVLGEETIYLPRLGAMRAYHLKPRPLNQPSGAISAEIWFAPTLQYLPVRILFTQDANTSANLLVDTIEQQ